MRKSNALYKNQGIHVLTAIFTVEQGVTKVLLVKRKNEPFKGDWTLTGGALYNNEDLDTGAKREIFEKTGIEDIEIEQFKTFGKVDRSSVMRMVAVAYIGVIDSSRVKVLRETINTSNADWFSIDKIPGLGFDHEEILAEALNYLRSKIVSTDILKALFPKKFDRRNFRKKLLSLNLIEDTKKTGKFEGKKPAELYKFKKSIKSQNVF